MRLALSLHSAEADVRSELMPVNDRYPLYDVLQACLRWRQARNKRVYVEYLMKALPAVARAVASNPEAYVYLAESIRAWPDQAALAQRIAGAGWRSVAWRDLTGGIVALHTATKPS